jgi:hypothetical protein
VVTTDETSSGANNGTASANGTGGTGIYMYSWNNGATTQTLTGLTPGTYCVTVTDANGCTVTGCGQVNAFGCNLDVSVGIDVAICEGDTTLITAVVSGAVGSTTYIWSNGSTSSSISVSAAGEYCVTVTDMANCQDIDCINVSVNTVPAFDCPVTNESAPGANDGAIDCDSIPGVVAYLWSNGQTTGSVSGLAPGQYCVTVTDLNGCTGTQCFNVQAAGCQMTVSATVNGVACFGGTTGSIVLSVNGGTAPITYQWSNGATTETNSNLVAGNYTVTVTDALACVVIQSYEITQAPAIVVTVDSLVPVQDFDSGLIHISVTGGTSPYAYLWTFPNGGSSNLEDLENLSMPGDYILLVTDASGCTFQDTITVPMDVAVEPISKFKAVRVFPVPVNDILIIDMEVSIEELTIYSIDGRAIEHAIRPADNRINTSDLEPGWYLLRITDGNRWYISTFIK